MSYQLLLQRFLDNVNKSPDKDLFTFVDDKGKQVASYTYKQFEEVTRSVALELLKKGCKKGDNVVLVYPPSLDFIVAFIACLRAGVVAVPVYPPHPSKKKDINQFIAIQGSSGAKVALTNTEYKYAKKTLAIKNAFVNRSVNKTWPELKWITTNNIKVSSDQNEALDSAVEADLAFLQYTSGSTSLPKGVMLSHRNISHNLSCIVRALEAADYVKVVSWLPQYHDMGLIGAYLGVLYCGGSGIYMSPFSLIKNPVVWLKMISRFQATHIQSPNFAFRLTLRKFKVYEEKVGGDRVREEINLSSLRHIFNAAEPIDVAAMNQFRECFGPYGLNPEAFSPGYGLAENTVYVCDNGNVSVRVDSHSLEGKGVVDIVEESVTENVSVLQGCGDPHRFPEANIHVVIVDINEDRNTLLQEEGTVGEIWVTSPSKSEGYYNQEDLSVQLLKAKLVPGGEQEEDEIYNKEWLRTGDLGFMYKKELFVCGRLKDLVIVRGRNHFPQDIEYTVENDHAFAKDVRPGCSAAFSIMAGSGEEVLVVVVEVRNTSVGKKDKVSFLEMANAIKSAVTQNNEVSPFAISLIKQGSIVKTTSGKIKRHGNKIAFLNNDLQELFRLDPSNTREVPQQVMETAVTQEAPTNAALSIEKILEELKDEAARLMAMDVDQIPEDTQLTAMGMDSVYLTEFKGTMMQKYNVEVEEEELFGETMTIKKLAQTVFNKMNGIDLPQTNEVSEQVKEASSKKTGKKKKRKGKFLFCS